MRRTVKILFFAALAIGFAAMNSCMLGRKYSSPELDLPRDIENIGAITDSLTLADLAWWELYDQHGLLKELIYTTLENNRDYTAAAYRVEELARLRRISTADLLPNLSVQAYGDREWENYYRKSHSEESEFGAKLRVSWELDLWGGLRWARQKSMAEFLASVENRRALEMSLVAEVATCYFQLIALDNELVIVRQTLRTREEGVRQAKLRYEGGLTSETSYRQAQVERATTASLIPDLERRVRLKENEISMLAGEFPGEVNRRVVDINLPTPDIIPTGLPSELLKRRPDLRRAEQSLIAANAAVGIAHTDRFPKLVLSGAYGLEGDHFGRIFQSPYGLVAGTLAAPVFGFGKKKAKYQAQLAAYERENALYEKAVLGAFREVSDAIISYQSVKEGRRLKSELEEAARINVDLAHLQYINGAIRYIDVLDAQRRYFEAQIGLSNAIRDEHTALIQLYKALGGGWTP